VLDLRTTSATIHREVYRTDGDASVKLYLAACTTTTKRREQNKIYLYAAVNLKRNLRSVYCTIEATDRHEASRGLSATPELLVQTRRRSTHRQCQSSRFIQYLITVSRRMSSGRFTASALLVTAWPSNLSYGSTCPCGGARGEICILPLVTDYVKTFLTVSMN